MRKRLLSMIGVVAGALVLAAPATAAPSGAVTIVHPTAGLEVTDSSISPALDFTNEVTPFSQHCKLDDAPYLPCFLVTLFPPMMGNGNHRFSVRTTELNSDPFGPGQTYVDTVDFTVDDSDAPDLTASVVGGSPVTDRLRIELTTTESRLTVVAAVDGRGPERIDLTESPQVWSPDQLANGSHTIEFRAYDPALNSVTASVSFDVNDETAPSISIVTPSPLEEFPTGEVAATFTSDDEDAVFTCSVDDSAPQSCRPSVDVNLSGLGDGNHSFAVQARDRAGNSSAASHAFTVGDEVAVGLSIDSPADGSMLTAQPLLDVSSIQLVDDQQLRCSVNGAPFRACADGSPIPGLDSNGPATLTVRAVDENGDRVEAASTFTVSDSSPPLLTAGTDVATVPNIDAFALPATVSDEFADGSASDEYDVLCRIDGGALNTCFEALLGPALGQTPTLTFGAHTIELIAIDWIGNADAATVSIDVTDNVGPTVEILSPADGASISGRGLTVDFVATGPTFFGIPMLCRVDSNPTVSCGSSDLDGVNSWTPAGLTTGAHTITVSRIDLAGNVGSDTVSVTVGDSTGPSLEFLAPAPAAVLTDRVSAHFVADERIVSLRCAVDDAANLAADEDHCATFADRRSGFFRPPAIADGPRTLIVEASDVHGNSASAVLAIQVADDTAPDLRVGTTDYGSGDPATDAPRTIEFISSDTAATIECEFDGTGSAFEPCGEAGFAEYAVPPVAAGSHTVRARATDPSGNATTVMFAFEVYDVTPPALTVNGVYDGLQTGANLDVEIVTDGDAATTCAIDAAAFAACGASHRFTFGTSGAHTVRFRATDPSGNATNRAFVVNATVPAPPVVPPPAPANPPATTPATAVVKFKKPSVKFSKRAAVVRYTINIGYPVGSDDRVACSGSSTITLRVGRKSLAKGRAPLKLSRGSCSITGSLKTKPKLLSRKRFQLTATFPGNAALAAFSKAQQGKAGRARF